MAGTFPPLPRLERGLPLKTVTADRTLATATDRTSLPYRWVVLALMASCFVMTFFIRFAWPPLIPVVVPVLGMKMSQAGAFMSAFYIGYVLTQIPAGLLADKFGSRLIITVSLVVEGLATFAMGYIASYEAGFALRVLTGLGAGAVYGACIRPLMQWFAPKERGTAFGVMLGAPSAGIVLSSLVVPGLNGALGWQGALKACGVAAMVVGVIVYLLVRSSEEDQKSGSVLEGFKIVFGSKDLMLTALCGFCLLWLELGTATWTIAHVKKLGFSLPVASSILLLYGLGGVIAPFLSGWLSDKIGHRKWILAGSLALAVPVTLLFGQQTDIGMLRVWGFVFGFCSYLANPHLSLMISEFAGKQWAGLANGTSNAIFQAAPIIGPVVMGWSIDVTGSFASVWWMMAAGPVVGILLLLPVNPANKRD